MQDAALKTSDADYEYFNGSIRRHATESSVLVSSSKYLNHVPLRELMGQEMLRRNGADLPSTAFIVDYATMINQLEDRETFERMMEAEAVRLPEFGAWLDAARLTNFTAQDVAGYAEGTLGAKIHDFIVNSGYDMDYMYKGMKIETRYQYLMKQRAIGHDIEHMITGYEPNRCGETALAKSNMRSFFEYFSPEFASALVRIQVVTTSVIQSRLALHYPAVMRETLIAEQLGLGQGEALKTPLFIVGWHDYLDWQIDDIRIALNIINVPPPGHWAWTTAAAADPR